MWALFDSLLNVVTGLGTAADKSIATTYALPYVNPAELEAMYRGDWIAQKAVDLPAQDATREWRSWQADGDTKETLENEERRLQIQFKCQEAQTLARLYGGAAMVIGVKGQSADTPLDLTRVGKGALEFVDVLHRHELSTGPIIRDPTSLWQKEPEWYTRTDSTQLRIHPSRVVRFLGKPVRSFYSRIATDEGWGDSVLVSVRDAVRDAGVAQHAGAALLHDMNVDVYKVPNLTELVSNKKYEDKLLKRFAVSNLSKSMYRALVVDSEEEWERVSAQLTGLPDMVLTYLMLAAGAVDIPATRFLSQSPKGLNATGESDLKNYYDSVGSEQKNKIQPAMSRLDDVLIVSATGKRDPSIFYNWNPLWQMTDTEKADIFLKKAQTHQIIASNWVGDPSVLQRAHEAQLIDDGLYPALEQELEENKSDMEAFYPKTPDEQLAQQQQLALPPPASEVSQGSLKFGDRDANWDTLSEDDQRGIAEQWCEEHRGAVSGALSSDTAKDSGDAESILSALWGSMSQDRRKGAGGEDSDMGYRKWATSVKPAVEKILTLMPKGELSADVYEGICTMVCMYLWMHMSDDEKMRVAERIGYGGQQGGSSSPDNKFNETGEGLTVK